MKVASQIVFVFFLFVTLTSCSNDEVLMNNIDNKWNQKDAKSFDFNIQDNQIARNIVFVVRNNNSYQYSNLRLIAVLEKDKKAISVDTLNYVLAKPNGEWLGNGFGEVKENQFQYKVDYKFPTNGNYSIKVSQAMRQNILVGIDDFGVKIQDIKP